MIIVLNSYGGSLSRSNSNFLVCNEEKNQIVPVYGVSAIQVWRSNRISTDAIMLALDNDIDIVFMDKKGYVKGRVWNCKFGSIATIRKGQLYFESSPEGVAWIKKSVDGMIVCGNHDNIDMILRRKPVVFLKYSWSYCPTTKRTMNLIIILRRGDCHPTG